ncbi:Pld1 phospholipase D1 [Candida orthopsilosis Co 90-125]|uniref:Phospholipase n=1 Tax=Candida orthopsilosis (strain 90-125) TaxID=1136231 RepID=H8X5C3_CANO9|nr:Pld1 phospholipase D1 [Candida orthopsilosis Co 90-125]CCG23217.1 Pld1 phospholipase D1 [Candida orthopsilosis Co 90-125]
MPTLDSSGHDQPEAVSDSTPDLNNSVQNNVPTSRESPDIRQLYRSLSGESQNQSSTSVKRASNKSPLYSRQSSSHIISNPISFFNRWGEDPQESRYSSEEEEAADRDDTEQEGATYGSENRPTSHWSNQPDESYQNEPTSPQSRRPSAIQNFTKFVSRSNRDGQIEPKRKRKDKHQRPGSQMGEQNYSYTNTDLRAQRLINSFIINGPSLGIMASCLFVDEGGIARAPLLFSLLGFNIVDISSSEFTKNRNFRIDLEYGVGDKSMKWSIERTITDLFYLHSRCKIDNWKTVFGTKTKLPKFPIPSFKDRRKKTKVSDTASQINSVLHGDADNQSIMSTQSGLSRMRSRLGSLTSAISREHVPKESRSDYVLKLRRKNGEYLKQMEDYLKELIEFVALTPLSNYVFMFFEISPISSLLNYEGSFQGKQGSIHISSSAKSQGWRVGHFKANDLKGMYDRRTEKWMLVRNSYVVYVSDINSTTPLDVFLVDSNFKIHTKNNVVKDDDENVDFDENEAGKNVRHHAKIFPHLKIVLENRERKLVLNPKSSREHKAWLESFRQMQHNTEWGVRHRFDSFAPIRQNCFAQWFVDGRDYFWAVSAAIEMAKETIYIHDWWLSPELYLRRPALGNQQYRIDRLLQRKAREGVKIFVIVYRNVGTTVATDSLYTKHSLLWLNEENIHVIRSPNQLLQNTFFWAHHEKLCIVDSTYAFLGGIDLCYGRYDTADHVLADDSPEDFEQFGADDYATVADLENFQVFMGKDYSNPRVKDFFDLDKPYKSMYNRQTTPRMPWHDIHMMTYGKVARDLSRHFVQRWNYLIRQKRPSRLTPLLLPPPDFTDEEARNAGYSGTCEVQLLRSSGKWSLGLEEHEQSIQNAYLKLIETSEHFVYIENQFFVTSCFIDGVEIKNRIGDALVERIIRAHQEGSIWKAIIVIPLMPGFEAQVDEAEGSSVRVIMQCQFMSISRGETSIFAKLRKKGINPDDYIQFFSLRKWGRIGPQRTLVTEQLYIHAKCMIVDDRSVIIGSANINERSMRGVRDSEVAAVVRDTEMISTRMNGVPYKAARFAHTLRMRLMREHLGVNIDILDTVERRFKRFEEFAKTEKGLKFATNKFRHKSYLINSAMVEIASRDVLNEKEGTRRWKDHINISNLEETVAEVNYEEEVADAPKPLDLPTMFNYRTGPKEANMGVRDKKKKSYDNRVQHSDQHKEDVRGYGLDKYQSEFAKSARLSSSKFLQEKSLQVMESGLPRNSFLPSYEDVLEFLNCDDDLVAANNDEESEQLINERNQERWILLKKVSYLQRVAANEMKYIAAENKKRASAGLSPLKPSNDMNGTLTEVDESTTDEKPSPEEAMRSGFQAGSPVSCSDQEIKDILDTISSPDAECANSFIDPYGFEDPLEPEFYELLWFEIARKNTDIFRMVFHCQPDDAVARWSDYTNFSKLQSKFMKGQTVAREPASTSKPETSELSEDILHLGNNNEQTTDGLGEDIGVLGRVPPEKKEMVDLAEHESKRRHKLARKFSSVPGISDINGKEKNHNDELDDDGKSPVVDENESREDVEQDTTEESPTHGSARKDNGASKTHERYRKNRATNFATRRRMLSGELIYDKETAEKLLGNIKGHLVLFPVQWLDVELENDNWFYNTDRIPPMEIYD